MRTKNKYRVDNNTEEGKGVRTTRKELINRRKKTRKQSRNKKRIKSHNKKSHKLDSNNFIIHKGRKIDTNKTKNNKTKNNKTKNKSRYNKGDIYIDNDVFNYFFGGKLSDSQYKITFPLNDFIINESKWPFRTKKAGDTKKLLDKDTSLIKEELNKLDISKDKFINSNNVVKEFIPESFRELGWKTGYILKVMINNEKNMLQISHGYKPNTYEHKSIINTEKELKVLLMDYYSRIRQVHNLFKVKDDEINKLKKNKDSYRKIIRYIEALIIVDNMPMYKDLYPFQPGKWFPVKNNVEDKERRAEFGEFHFLFNFEEGSVDLNRVLNKDNLKENIDKKGISYKRSKTKKGVKETRTRAEEQKEFFNNGFYEFVRPYSETKAMDNFKEKNANLYPPHGNLDKLNYDEIAVSREKLREKFLRSKRNLRSDDKEYQGTDDSILLTPQLLLTRDYKTPHIWNNLFEYYIKFLHVKVVFEQLMKKTPSDKKLNKAITLKNEFRKKLYEKESNNNSEFESTYDYTERIELNINQQPRVTISNEEKNIYVEVKKGENKPGTENIGELEIGKEKIHIHKRGGEIIFVERRYGILKKKRDASGEGSGTSEYDFIEFFSSWKKNTEIGVNNSPVNDLVKYIPDLKFHEAYPEFEMKQEGKTKKINLDNFKNMSEGEKEKQENRITNEIEEAQSKTTSEKGEGPAKIFNSIISLEDQEVTPTPPEIEEFEKNIEKEKEEITKQSGEGDGQQEEPTESEESEEPTESESESEESGEPTESGEQEESSSDNQQEESTREELIIPSISKEDEEKITTQIDDLDSRVGSITGKLKGFIQKLINDPDKYSELLNNTGDTGQDNVQPGNVQTDNVQPGNVQPGNNLVESAKNQIGNIAGQTMGKFKSGELSNKISEGMGAKVNELKNIGKGKLAAASSSLATAVTSPEAPSQVDQVAPEPSVATETAQGQQQQQ